MSGREKFNKERERQSETFQRDREKENDSVDVWIAYFEAQSQTQRDKCLARTCPYVTFKTNCPLGEKNHVTDSRGP